MRRGLLIGVPETAYDTALFAPLPGALSDVANMRQLLLHRGYGPNDLLCPTGDGLTAAAVQEALLRLVVATTDSDLAVIYFSGHGWQFPDQTGDESDHLDESLVCADKPIGDDWFRSKLWPKARAGRFVIVVDACHSDSAMLGLRANPQPVPPPAPVTEPRRWRLSLAACRDEEIALAAAADDGGASVVTSTMYDILRRQPQLTHDQLWPSVARQVRDAFAHRGAGAPQQRYSGPDESLLRALAFHPGDGDPGL